MKSIYTTIIISLVMCLTMAFPVSAASYSSEKNADSLIDAILATTYYQSKCLFVEDINGNKLAVQFDVVNLIGTNFSSWQYFEIGDDTRISGSILKGTIENGYIVIHDVKGPIITISKIYHEYSNYTFTQSELDSAYNVTLTTLSRAVTSPATSPITPSGNVFAYEPSQLSPMLDSAKTVATVAIPASIGVVALAVSANSVVSFIRLNKK